MLADVREDMIKSLVLTLPLKRIDAQIINEIDKYTDMNQILDMAEQIKDIDTKKTTPTAHPLKINQRLREDKVTEINLRDALQSIAINYVELGLYLVPQVIE